MMRKRRKTPLHSLEEICNKNGIFFNKTKKSDFINVTDGKGNTYKLGKDFNMFDKF